MTKYITIKLTEDQARDILERLEDGVRNNKAWIEEAKNKPGSPLYWQGTAKTERKIAFRLRVIDKLRAELVK